MALTGLLSLLGSQPWLQRHLRNLDSPGARASLTLNPDHNPLYLAAICQLQQRPVVVISPRLDDARRLYDQLQAYLGDDAPVFLLPEPEVLAVRAAGPVDARHQQPTAVCPRRPCRRG